MALAKDEAVAPAGFALEPDRIEDITVCDGLVESGHLIAIDIEEGCGYRASDEFFKATVVHKVNRAKQAENN